MIVARLYSVPVPGGTVLVATEPALADLAAGAHLAAIRLLEFGVDVYVDSPLPEATVTEPARLVARRAAAAAIFPASALPMGPQGRWYAVLVIWGWLAVLSAAQSAAQVLGGLWLAVGLPWARGRQRRGADLWSERAAGALASALRANEVVPVHQFVHAGLQRLKAALDATPGDAGERLRAVAVACAAAGVPHLESFYLALAQEQRPSGIWAFIPRADGGRGPAAKVAREGAATTAEDTAITAEGPRSRSGGAPPVEPVEPRANMGSRA